jgi:arylsulfatase A-like enzyme
MNELKNKSMNRRELIKLMGIGAASAALPGCVSRQKTAAERPNIILVMADDLGWGDTGYNGNPVVKTPVLDDMARKGIRFDRFYSGAPLCSPTRGSCLTGRHPYRYGIFWANSGHMKKEEITLAEALKSSGYTTGHFGKWHVGTLTKTEKDSNRGGRPENIKHFSPPWENGFDQSFCTEARTATWDPLIRPKHLGKDHEVRYHKGKPFHVWWDPVKEGEETVSLGLSYWENGKKVTEPLRGDDSRIIMDRAIPFIQNAVKQKQPFLTVIWFHTPHFPVVAGPEYTKHYKEHDKLSQHYFGCITAMDEQIGRLRKELRTLGAAENTMLWFCSDNGPEGTAEQYPSTAGPFRGRKRDLLEGGIRVPAILEWPSKIKSGLVTDLPCCTSDYFPTVMDILGLKLPGQVQPVDGVSLAPLIAGKMRLRPRPIGFESRNPRSDADPVTRNRLALIDNRYKLLRYGDESEWELYDLIEDPGETKNLASEYPKVLERMRKALLEWRASCARSLAGADYK